MMNFIEEERRDYNTFNKREIESKEVKRKTKKMLL